MATATIIPQERANLRAAKRATQQQRAETYRTLLARLSETLDITDGRIVAATASTWESTRVSYIVSVVSFSDGIMTTPKRVRNLTASMEINTTIGRLVRSYPAWSCVPNPIGAGFVASHSDWSSYVAREEAL